MNRETTSETATLAGGCFWCLEAVFELLRGAIKVESGYTGGKPADPTYEQICTGATGHAEAVRIEFDPARISFNDLLEVFFAIHDPTTLNRQGNDWGTQYRSAVFYHDPAQKEAAEAMIARLTAERAWPGPIVTEVVPAEVFYKAENYHQEYFRQHGEQPYCQLVVAPKVAKLKQKFAKALK